MLLQARAYRSSRSWGTARYSQPAIRGGEHGVPYDASHMARDTDNIAMINIVLDMHHGVCMSVFEYNVTVKFWNPLFIHGPN